MCPVPQLAWNMLLAVTHWLQDLETSCTTCLFILWSVQSLPELSKVGSCPSRVFTSLCFVTLRLGLPKEHSSRTIWELSHADPHPSPECRPRNFKEGPGLQGIFWAS